MSVVVGIFLEMYCR